MIRYALVLLLLATAVTPLRGQTPSAMREAAAAERAAEAGDFAGMARMMAISTSAIAYSLSGNLGSTTTSASPRELLLAVRGDKNLVSLHAGSAVFFGDARGDFEITFTFDSMDEFNTWFASSAAEGLHKGIEAAAADGEVSIDLFVNNVFSGREE